MKCIYLFHRDLRLTDNTTLIAALKKYDKVLPVFIYDVNQITPFSGQVLSCEKSARASSKDLAKNHNFLYLQEQALEDLDEYLKLKGTRLLRMYGSPHKVINYLIKIYKPEAVAFNKDYSVYAQIRTAEIAKVCAQYSVEILSLDDYYIHKEVTDRKLTYVRLFSDFAIASTNYRDIQVQKNNMAKYDMYFPPLFRTSIPFQLKARTKVTATRKAALARIKTERTQNWRISSHLKLGLISAREVYKYAINVENLQLQRQLLWRDYYLAVWLHFSDIRGPAGNYEFYDERYSKIQWRNDPVECKAMWTGQTGFVIIDAAIRKLNKTGFIKNRYRLLVAYFSIKILRINPFLAPDKFSRELSRDEVREEADYWTVGGQIHFSRTLIDCCYIANTANWHFAASDLLDASGQRFGKGWSGRSYNIEPKPEDKKFIEKWKPKKNTEPICDLKMRWQEWRSMTSLN